MRATPVERVRRFEQSDWVRAIMACPHCGELLKIVSAEGPHIGFNPSLEYRIDRFWIVVFADGTDARMWEDRKGMVVNPVVTS